MTKYIVYGYGGEERTFKSLSNARKFAITLQYKPVEIRNADGEPIGSVSSMRQDDPERNIVYRYVPIYTNYSNDKVSILNRNGDIIHTFKGRVF